MSSTLPINWNTAIQYAALVKIAESVTPSGSYGEPELTQIKAAGYTFLQPLYGDDLATDIDPHVGDVVSLGFLAVSAAKEDRGCHPGYGHDSGVVT